MLEFRRTASLFCFVFRCRDGELNRFSDSDIHIFIKLLCACTGTANFFRYLLSNIFLHLQKMIMLKVTFLGLMKLSPLTVQYVREENCYIMHKLLLKTSKQTHYVQNLKYSMSSQPSLFNYYYYYHCAVFRQGMVI